MHREGGLKLALNPAHCRPWLCSAQRCLQSCPFSALWLESTSSTISLCLWPKTHNRTCTQLQPRRIPIIIRHNEIRDMTDNLMREVCYGVGIEPCLQEVTEQQLMHKSANREDGSCPDIAAENFGGEISNVHFMVRVFNPFVQSHLNTPLAQCY